MKPERLSRFLTDVRELVQAVRFDESGSMVGQQFVGGNGGLLSRETLQKNEAVARDLDVIESIYK